MDCYRNLRIALLDGLLVYLNTKDIYTSMHWRKSFLLSGSMPSILSLEFKL
jgi:hypothetical protein